MGRIPDSSSGLLRVDKLFEMVAKYSGDPRIAHFIGQHCVPATGEDAGSGHADRAEPLTGGPQHHIVLVRLDLVKFGHNEDATVEVTAKRAGKELQQYPRDGGTGRNEDNGKIGGLGDDLVDHVRVPILDSIEPRRVDDDDISAEQMGRMLDRHHVDSTVPLRIGDDHTDSIPDKSGGSGVDATVAVP